MTVEDPDMKPLTGVFRQRDTVNWSYQKKTPEELLQHPAIGGNKWGFRGSLGTPSLREANANAAAKLVELEAHWSTLRASQHAAKPTDVTPALAAAIAQRVKAAVLAEDESLRADPLALAQSLAGWWEAHERGRRLAHERAERDAHTEGEAPAYRPLPVPRWLTRAGLEELLVYVQGGNGAHPLAEDELLRGDPLALADSLSHWWSGQERARKMAHERAQRDALTEAQEPAPYRPLKVPHWLTQEGREELQVYVKAGQGCAALADLLELLQERHERAATQARQALGKGNTGPFLVLAEREALALGVNLDADAWMSPEVKPLRDACQRAYPTRAALAADVKVRFWAAQADLGAKSPHSKPIWT